MTQEPEQVVIEGGRLAAPVEIVPGLLRFWRVVRYRRRGIFACTSIAILAGSIYFALATRLFEASAKLLIIQQNQEQFSTITDEHSSDSTMATHRELVKSPIVVRRALEQLRPEYRVDLEGVPAHEWVEETAAALSAQTTRNTNFIEVSYASRRPEAAAAMVSSVITAYLEFVRQTHKGAAGDAIEVLTAERTRVQATLDAKHRVLRDDRQRVGQLAMPSEQGVVEPIVQRAIRFNDALLAAQEKRLELQSMHASLNGAVARGEDISQYLVGLESVVGREMLLAGLGLSHHDHQVLSTQQQRLMAAQNQLREVSGYYGARHPQVAQIQEEVAAITKFLQEYHGNVGERFAKMGAGEMGPVVVRLLGQSVRQAEERERQLTASFEAARDEAARHSDQLMQLEMAEREVARLEALLGVLSDKIDAVDIRQVQAPIQVAVVREPIPTLAPVSPKLPRVLLLSVLGGLTVGGLLVYVQDLLDDRFTSPEEMSGQLGVPILAMVRALEPLGGEAFDTVYAHAQPNSVEAEAFRTLRTALALQSGVSERVLISSSEPGDGKTTVTANLSVSFAQTGKRTLVIDADLRKPGMTALLGLRGAKGVADILCDARPPADAAMELVQQTDVPNLHVLPAGLRRPNPAELLTSRAFSELLAWADSQYDQVLVDCPPVLAVSDAQIVGQLVDGAILVVRPEKNHRRLVMRAVESFHSTGCRVVGVVANGISAESAGYGYGYGYSYGYGYGHDEESAGDVTDARQNDYQATAYEPMAKVSEQDEPHYFAAKRQAAEEPAPNIRPRRAA